MAVPAVFPRFYPILDAGLLVRSGIRFERFAEELRDAGIRFLQYRDKDSSDEEVLARAAWLRGAFSSSDSCLILNDRVGVAAAADFDGVHLGWEDMPPAEARAVLGARRTIGLSTHTGRQMLAAVESGADYLAIGPVFATSSKHNPDPMVGLEGIRAVRGMTNKPLVAIGGITRSNCAAVLRAGADCVAVISDLLPDPDESTGELAKQFLFLAEHRSP